MKRVGDYFLHLAGMKIEEGREDGSEVKILHEVENILGYKFKNRKLLENAFIYGSAEFEKLEYLGDSVLNTLITTEQMIRYPDLSSGKLTQLRSVNIDTERLSRVAIKHKLHHYIRHNSKLLQERIEEYTREIEEYPVHSQGLIDAPKALADLVESLIGAVYTDTDFRIDIVWRVFGAILQPFVSPLTFRRHPTSELNELCQKHNLKLVFVDRWAEMKTFDVLINGKLFGSATYGAKKDVARHRAANIALRNIQTILEDKKDFNSSIDLISKI